MPSTQIMLKKSKRIGETKDLLKKHKVVGVASLQKVRAPQLQELKRNLKNYVYAQVTKNTIMKRAIVETHDKPELKKFVDHISGSNIFLFTDMNPFKLLLLLEKSKVKTMAKAGDEASEDVVIPAGNTGLPPGPIISQFNAVGLPTRIESGSVSITRETLVVKKGEVISARLAAALSKLEIRSVESMLKMKAAYDDGIIITEDQLTLNVIEVERNLTKAHSDAFNLSLNIAYPFPENITFIIQAAHNEAFNLALNSKTPTKDTITFLLKKAYGEVLNLSKKIGWD